MKNTKIAVTFAIAAITFSGGAMANEIYKWTDEDGNVHYEDRPTGAASEERLSLTYRRTDSSAVQQRVQTRVDARSAQLEARAAAADAANTAAENAEIAAARKQKCERSRARLETYLQSRRLYRTDDNGERVYLDEDQRQQARKKAEDQVAEFCS